MTCCIRTGRLTHDYVTAAAPPHDAREFVGPALRVHERQVNTVTYSIVNAFGWPEWKAWKRRCERRAQASCAGAASLTTHERALYVALEVCVAMGFWLSLKPPSIWKDTTTIRRAAAVLSKT